MSQIAVFWLRRDLRLSDNVGLHYALQSGFSVLPVFIFDTNIIEGLPKNDARLSFIHAQLESLNTELAVYGSGVLCLHGDPKEVWRKLISEYQIAAVFTNKDYEPYALQRDKTIVELLSIQEVEFHSFKDHVIFEENEVLKNDGTPYTVYTPYKNKWRSQFSTSNIKEYSVDNWQAYYQFTSNVIGLEELGFEKASIKIPTYDLNNTANYGETRNIPSVDGTSRIGPHLRFGTVSIREVARQIQNDEIYFNELIWREFFIQILFHFPHVVSQNFRAKYDAIQWRNDDQEFEKWCQGNTGYPIVDAGMRELNTTGHMHNRVRMVVASFLCKHLLIDWRWGEAYFAEKLLDYELASNNGNWQWSAGTGCDAAPYFRVFNPTEQTKKFDKELKYIRKWVPELEMLDYPMPMVNHKFARDRALNTYKQGLMDYERR